MLGVLIFAGVVGIIGGRKDKAREQKSKTGNYTNTGEGPFGSFLRNWAPCPQREMFPFVHRRVILPGMLTDHSYARGTTQ